MKKVLVMMLAITGILFATSCSESNDYEDAELVLSENSVEFQTSEKAEKSISVTTNQEKWSAIGSAEWITVVRDDKKLVIKVEANKSIEARKGKVLVVAGNANATIEVKQAGENGVANINPENIEVDQYAGSMVIDIMANDQNWTATTTVDWLTLTPKQQKYELAIKYTENKDREDRTAKIIVTVGDTKKEITVVQSGIMFYILPFIDFSKDIKAIKAFEKQRGSELRERSSWDDKWVFETRSPFFPSISYKMNGSNGVAYLEAIVNTKDIETFKKDLPGFKEFLVKEGFKVDGENENNYYNAEKSVLAIITILEDKKVSGVIYRKEYRQSKEQPTFAKLPYIPEVPFGATGDEVKAYEAAHNGKYDETNSVENPNDLTDTFIYDVQPKGENTLFKRLYLIIHDKTGNYNDGVAMKQLWFENLELVFFTTPDKRYKLSKEFVKLAKSEGYKYVAGPDSDGYFIFKNVEKQINLKVRPAKLGEGDNAKIIIDMLWVRADLRKKTNNSSTTTFKVPMSLMKI